VAAVNVDGQRKPAPEPETFRAVDGISFAVGKGEPQTPAISLADCK
jgi:hypothetical protein